jgi:hypothetical protein
MSTLDEMWKRLEAHQSFADQRGYGKQWKQMCEQRAAEVADAADAVAAAAAASWAADVADAADWAADAIESINKAEIGKRQSKPLTAEEFTKWVGDTWNECQEKAWKDKALAVLRISCAGQGDNEFLDKAEAELRRLHEENERLWKEREEPHKQIETYLLECNRLERERDSARAENERLGKLCDYFMGQLMVLRAEKQLREAIAKAEGGK